MLYVQAGTEPIVQTFIIDSNARLNFQVTAKARASIKWSEIIVGRHQVMISIMTII